MTLLIFFPATAGARIIPANLFSNANGLGLIPTLLTGFLDIGLLSFLISQISGVSMDKSDLPGSTPVRLRGFHEFSPPQHLQCFLINGVDQIYKHVVGFPLVFNQRIFLPISAQVDSFF